MVWADGSGRIVPRSDFITSQSSECFGRFDHGFGAQRGVGSSRGMRRASGPQPAADQRRPPMRRLPGAAGSVRGFHGKPVRLSFTSATAWPKGDRYSARRALASEQPVVMPHLPFEAFRTVRCPSAAQDIIQVLRRNRAASSDRSAATQAHASPWRSNRRGSSS
jgi:hypothetical protein